MTKNTVIQGLKRSGFFYRLTRNAVDGTVHATVHPSNEDLVPKITEFNRSSQGRLHSFIPSPVSVKTSTGTPVEPLPFCVIPNIDETTLREELDRFGIPYQSLNIK